MRKLFLFIIFLVLFSSNIYANSVNITLPNFDVNLNGRHINNEYMEYPLIVYDEITYFPMTYSDSRFLGVITNWTNDKGLQIETGNNFGSLNEMYSTIKNNYEDKAKIANFNIFINGEEINNSEQKYPLLVYRDVTYFPLTYEFAVEKFGWQLAFDERTGLQINSHNFEVETVNIKNNVEDFNMYQCFHYFDEHYYFLDNTEKTQILYRYNYNTKKKDVVLELDDGEFGEDGGNVAKFLNIVNDKLILSYYDIDTRTSVQYEIVEDKAIKNSGEIYDSYNYGDTVYYKSYRYGYISIIYYDGDEKYEFKAETPEGFYPYIPSKNCGNIVVGDYIYLFNRANSVEGKSNILKVNYKTWEFQTINESTFIDSYYIWDETIYYKNEEDKKLYAMNLDGNNISVVIDEPIQQQLFIDNKIYFISEENYNSLRVYHFNGLEEFWNIDLNTEDYLMKANENYIYFILYDDPNYKILVLNNKTGDYSEVVKITDNIEMSYSDEVASYKILDDGIIYLNKDTGNLVKLKFKD